MMTAKNICKWKEPGRREVNLTFYKAFSGCISYNGKHSAVNRSVVGSSPT